MSEPESDEFCALGNFGSGYQNNKTSTFGSNNKETRRVKTSLKLIVKIYLEGAHQSLVYTHHPPGVVKLPAVVGGGEQGDQLSLREKLVTILHDLRQINQWSVSICAVQSEMIEKYASD